MPAPSRSPAADRARLIEIVKARSFQTGAQMKLASGRTSSFYFNMKPTMLDAEGGLIVANLILDQIENASARWIGGLEMGAVPIAAAVAAASAMRGRPISAFFVRKLAKEHGTRSLIEGLAPGERLGGARVVVVEDVTTTGGSALKAAEAVRAEGGEVVRIVTIVDRLEGAAEAFRAAGLTFAPLLTLDDFR
ncbi:MAG: orotate phosphoribosyltransferase [Hyphomicrobiaceae bacterium]|nr:orotate phosphoribosyltransferase [Hyphomicrobiaceae bacterium]